MEGSGGAENAQGKPNKEGPGQKPQSQSNLFLPMYFILRKKLSTNTRPPIQLKLQTRAGKRLNIKQSGRVLIRVSYIT